MCYQIVERYSVRRCVYHRHSVDPCGEYGQPRHTLQEKNVLVGFSCSRHSVRRKEGLAQQIPHHGTAESIHELATQEVLPEGPIPDTASDEDETSSLVDCDIFSDAEWSTDASSLSGSLDQLQNANNAAEELGELFYAHEIVGPLLQIGFEVNSFEFGDYFTRLLRQYSTDLRKDVSNPLEMGA
jgi:hypothetical protein